MNQLRLLNYVEFGKNNRTLCLQYSLLEVSFQNWAPGRSLSNKMLKFAPGNPCIWWGWWWRCLLFFLRFFWMWWWSSAHKCRYFLCVVGWDEKQASEWEGEDFHLHLHMNIHIHHLWDWDWDLRCILHPPFFFFFFSCDQYLKWLAMWVACIALHWRWLISCGIAEKS